MALPASQLFPTIEPARYPTTGPWADDRKAGKPELVRVCEVLSILTIRVPSTPPTIEGLALEGADPLSFQN